MLYRIKICINYNIDHSFDITQTNNIALYTYKYQVHIIKNN